MDLPNIGKNESVTCSVMAKSKNARFKDTQWTCSSTVESGTDNPERQEKTKRLVIPVLKTDR
jgi:hypothetical protein